MEIGGIGGRSGRFEHDRFGTGISHRGSGTRPVTCMDDLSRLRGDNRRRGPVLPRMRSTPRSLPGGAPPRNRVDGRSGRIHRDLGRRRSRADQAPGRPLLRAIGCRHHGVRRPPRQDRRRRDHRDLRRPDRPRRRRRAGGARRVADAGDHAARRLRGRHAGAGPDRREQRRSARGRDACGRRPDRNGRRRQHHAAVGEAR